MRAAASSCLVFAYKVGGEDAWKYIGRVGGQMRDALEDKFAKAEKEMDRKNEGRPGAWLKDGRLVGRGTGIAHAAVGAVPVPARSWARLRRDPSPRPVASPRLPRPWDRPSPPPQPAVLRPIGAAVSSIIPGRRNAAKETDTSEPLEAAAKAVPEEDRIVGWTRALGAGERERRGGCGGYEGDVPRDYGGGWGCGDARGDGARRRSPRRSSRQTHPPIFGRQPLLRLDHPPPARASTSSTPSCRCSRSPRWRRLSGRRTSV